MSDELFKMIHGIDKKTTSYHAANDERWKHTENALTEMRSDLKEVKNSVVGLKAKIASFVVACTSVAYLGIELLRLMLGG